MSQKYEKKTKSMGTTYTNKCMNRPQELQPQLQLLVEQQQLRLNYM